MLHHVSIEVPPEEGDRMVEFWGLLGFEEIESPEALGGSIRWLERDRNQIHLILTEGGTVPALGHAAVVAPDFEATMKALDEAGFEVEETRELWGERRAFAVGPAGHRVELMAAPPPPS
jgi:catechol 2,3-dioxygenase-like lactoylglutathione lyase family enzyme